MLKPILLFILCLSLKANVLNYVKICVDPAWMPMESIDINGNHIGIVADVLSLIEVKTNFKFTLVPTQSWEQSLAFIKETKCDVIPLISQTKERESWLNFTPIYIDYPEVLVTLLNSKKKSLEEALKLPLGLTKGYASIGWFRNKYPNIKIVEVENIDDAFIKLRNKEIYSYSDTMSIVGYKLQEDGILDLKISHLVDNYSLQGGMGISKENIKLHKELTKIINNLKKDEINDIADKWVKINIEDIGTNYEFAYKILGLILTIVLLILYWNYKLKSLVKKQTNKIQEFANTLEDKVKQKTQKIKHLLDNTGQGFLTLNKDFLIDSEYSKECTHLLGENILKQDISNILFKDKDKADRFKLNLSIIVGLNNEYTRLSAITLLPGETVVKEKILKIEYKLIDGNFMLILTNISDKKKLENDIQTKQDVLEMTVAVIKDNDIFFDIKKDLEYFSNNINDYIDKDKSSIDNINKIHRTIHTFKGTFMQLFMNTTASNLHNIESKLSQMLHNSDATTNDKLGVFLKDIDFMSFADDDLDSIKDTLGESFFNKSKFIPVKKQSLKTIEENCIELLKKHNEAEIEDMLEDIRVLYKKNLKSYLAPYARLTMQISTKVKKPIYEFEIIGDDNILLPDEFKGFIQSLVHVFRNSIDHGIEDSSLRYELGKDEIGSISCSFELKNQDLEIQISDDGCGIDIEEIRRYAENSNLTEKEAITYIFKDGFSTCSGINQLSGRGVGLSAVKNEIDKIDGNIEVQNKKDIGTKFIFTLAMPTKEEKYV